MTFQEFTPRMIEAVQEMVGEEYEVKIERIVKNNDQPLTGLTIRQVDVPEEMVPVQYLEPLFDQAEEGVPIRHLARLLVETDRTHKENGPQVASGSLTSFEEAKDHIFCKLISAERNEERLSSMPHRAWQDLAIVYYRDVEIGGGPGGEIRITNELMELYGVSADELHEVAFKNTLEQHPFEIEPLANVLGAMIGEDMTVEESPLYILTTSEKCNGAVCAIFPEAMKEASEKMGGNYYVIPSSIHELLLLKDDGEVKASQLEEMIRSINASMVPESEFLSDRAYYYEAKTERISLAAEYEAKNKQQDKIVSMAVASPAAPSM